MLSTPILAQVGAAIAAPAPFEEYDVRHVVLAGHSQTGGVVTEYVLNGHDRAAATTAHRVYDGYFPSGPRRAVRPLRRADRAGGERRRHLDPSTSPRHEAARTGEPTATSPADRYRLYELAGVPHMGTRCLPTTTSRCGGGPTPETGPPTTR